ncbi:MAG: hypothetical protein AAB669_02495 [Patescibacteria group bacterium]
MGKKWLWILSSLVIVVLIIAGIWLIRKPVEPAVTNTTAPESTAKTDTPTTWTKTGAAVSGQYADADTVKLADDSYRMYYGIQPEVAGNNFEVYSSTSVDGKTWTKEAGTRKTMATFPEVVQLVDGKFRMYFQSAGVIKSAISTDGLSFTDEAGSRIDKTNDLSLIFDNVAAPTVITPSVDGVFTMVYRGTINTPYAGEKVPNQNTQILLWATSPDGLTWTKKGLAVDSRTSLYGLADGPELFTWKDGTTRLSFWSYAGVFWSTFKDGGFTTPEKVFALAEATAMNKFPTPTPGDPTYAEFNDVWYMYYGQNTSIDYAVANN